jgi:hypothetical protein
MTQRITEKFLDNMIKNINNRTGRKYFLEYAYGGVKLVHTYENDGYTDESYRMTKREMYYVLDALQHFINHN